MSKGVPLSDDDVARILALRAGGATRKEAAAAMGIHPSTVDRALAPAGLARRAARAAAREARLARVRAMVAAGEAGVLAVSAALGCGHATAAALVREAGGRPRPRREMTTGEVRRILALRAQGLGAKRIARAIGRHRGVVGKALARLRAAGVAAALLLSALGGGEAAAHDWWTGLTQPDNPGVSCCSSNGASGDCYETSECILPNGKEGLISRRFGCVPINWQKVLPVSSPTGKPSLCESPYTSEYHPYCIVLQGSAGLYPDPGPAFAALEDEAAGICRGRP